MPVQKDNASSDNEDIEITPDEAAAILCLSPLTLKKWRCTKEQPSLPWRKRFKKVFYLKQDVIHFKRKKTISSVSEDTLI
jgi:hypothetical protein